MTMQKFWGKGKGRGSSQARGSEVEVSWLSASSSKQVGWLAGTSGVAWGVAGEVRTVLGDGGGERLEPLEGFEQRLWDLTCVSVDSLPLPCGDSTVRGAERGRFARMVLL